MFQNKSVESGEARGSAGLTRLGSDEAVLRRRLREWYTGHRRSLPWRETSDPYAIWVSEILLQQTRVATVIERYREFLERFPTVCALAEATEAEVLTAWSGLGYYRRARMLHQAAREVCARHGGVVPGSAAELRALPGIGRYTAAAIASIAFGEAVAAVDGNVERVVLRLAGAGLSTASEVGRRAQAEADRLLDCAAPGEWNQAMMELGATVCLPRGPRCEACPWVEVCRTRGEHPVRKRAAMRAEALSLAWVVRRRPTREPVERVWLVQRDERESVMPLMWELPETDGASGEPVLRLRHAIMQVNYEVAIFAVEATAMARRSRQRREQWVTAEEAGRMPLTGLTRKVMQRLGWLPAGGGRRAKPDGVPR